MPQEFIAKSRWLLDHETGEPIFTYRIEWVKDDQELLYQRQVKLHVVEDHSHSCGSCNSFWRHEHANPLQADWTDDWREGRDTSLVCPDGEGFYKECPDCMDKYVLPWDNFKYSAQEVR